MQDVLVAKQSNRLVLAGIIATALAARAPIAVIGPLTSFIQSDLNLSSTMMGLVTTIPMIMFALMTLVTGFFSRFISDKVLLLVSIALVFVSTTLRAWSGIAGLLLGTLVMGAAMGVLNVRIPVVVKSQFTPRVGFHMGLYSSTLSASSGLAVGICMPLMYLTNSWRQTMFLLALIAIPAIIIWSITPREGIKTFSETEITCFNFTWTEMKKHLPLGAFMGCQGLLFFSILAWLPTVLVTQGRTHQSASQMILFLQLVTLPTNLTCGMLLQRTTKKWHIGLIGCSLFFSGLLLITFSGGSFWLQIVGMAILGIGNGLAFAMPLALVGMSGQSERESSCISALTHFVCYSMAASGPLILGIIRDLTNSWSGPMYFMLAGTIVMFVFAKIASDRVDRFLVEIKEH